MEVYRSYYSMAPWPNRRESFQSSSDGGLSWTTPVVFDTAYYNPTTIAHPHQLHMRRQQAAALLLDRFQIGRRDSLASILRFVEFDVNGTVDQLAFTEVLRSPSSRPSNESPRAL